MSKRYIQKATREGRVALLPEYLQEGREVWYWRESLCEEDECPDGAGSCCPLNHGMAWSDPAVIECRRQHPVLEKCTVWSAAAAFTPRGVEWSINDLPAVPDRHLRSAFFSTRAEALKNRPGRIA